MVTLREEGFACTVIGMRDFCSQGMTQDVFYGDLVSHLVSEFNLDIEPKDWWYNHNPDYTAPSQRLKKFVEEELLERVRSSIVIFVDEIDSVLRLSFKDDFFAFVRGCYEKRAYKPKYNRLAFALLGVATPADLIKDRSNTPFNIDSQAIELTGFELDEATPLESGLSNIVANPKAVLQEVLEWTGGQPFLTQWICQLVLTNSSLLSVERVAESIENIVRLQVINNWLAQDRQQHLQTIRARLLKNEQCTCGLLGLYQQILQQGEIAADNSSDQMELQLSGLVVKRQGKLRVYNRIYKSVFDDTWVEKELRNLRPYPEALSAWEASKKRNPLHLLRGQNLQKALKWADGKSLSALDYQFLAASQNLELVEAQQEAKKKTRIGYAIFATSLVGAMAVTVWASQALKIEQIKALNLESENLLAANNQLESLMASVKAGQLQGTIAEQEKDLKYRTASTLQRVINTIVESNRLEGHNRVVNSVSFSPDGKAIASASGDGTVKLWKQDGTLLTTLTGHSAAVTSVNFSPDGKTIASASEDRTVKLWNWDGKQSKELATLKGHTDQVNSVSFNPNGKTIATASSDKTIKLWSWDANESTYLTTLKGHTDKVNSVSFSPDGKTIASASDDKTVKLWSWDANESTYLTTLKGHTDKVNSVSFSPDGKTIASASGDYTVKLWNWDANESTYLTTLKGQTDQVWSVSFRADGKTIVTASSDKTIKLWNRDGALLKALKGHTDRVTSVSFSQDGQTLATASFDKTIRIWKIGSLPSVLQGHTDEVYSVSFSPDGKTIASASLDRTAKLWRWDGKESTYLTTLKGHLDRVWSVRFSPNGKTIATASWDKTIKLWSWDGKKSTYLTSLGGEGKEGHTGWVFGISFRQQDGQTIASVGSDKNVILWDLKNKKIKKQWKSGHKANVVDVSFSPDGQKIATASDDRTVKLWRYPDGKLLRTLQGHLDEANGVSFSPDHKTIVTASDDKTVKLWSYPDGKYLRPLQGHDERVMNARFSPNGEVIATASFDKTVKLWKPDGTLLQTFSGHNDWVWDVSFSPDSKTLASASRDKTIRLWHFDRTRQQSSDIDALLTNGCNWLHDYLRNNPHIEESNRHICDG
jgi:WD40 repeat protein